MSSNPTVSRTRKILRIAAVPAVLIVLFVCLFQVKITRRWEGIYLLKARHGRPFKLKNDLYLGDGPRLIWGVTFWWLEPFRKLERLEKEAPCLYYEWDDKDGKGFVRNFLPGGARISTSFSRYNYNQNDEDVANDIEVHGLFVGGGLPAAVSSTEVTILNETGMAYWDGTRWYHLWCSVNESISPADTMKHIPPSEWKFLGSSVLLGTRDSLVITSAHEIPMQGQRLRMDRYAYFRAGNKYFIFSIWLKNEGDGPVSYYYNYGDEPWLGDFGDSQGNVGWIEDGLIKNTMLIDSKKYTYAGFFDRGINPPFDHTWKANFIEWFGNNTPAVYFTNGPEDAPPVDGPGEELSGDSRFIGLQWGPHTLNPGEKAVYVFAIGMADNDPSTGFPVKPEITLKTIPGQ